MVDGSSITLTRDVHAGVKNEDGTKIKLHSHKSNAKTYQSVVGFVCISIPALKRSRDSNNRYNQKLPRIYVMTKWMANKYFFVIKSIYSAFTC